MTYQFNGKQKNKEMYRSSCANDCTKLRKTSQPVCKTPPYPFFLLPGCKFFAKIIRPTINFRNFDFCKHHTISTAPQRPSHLRMISVSAPYQLRISSG